MRAVAGKGGAGDTVILDGALDEGEAVGLDILVRHLAAADQLHHERIERLGQAEVLEERVCWPWFELAHYTHTMHTTRHTT